jgi:deoxycytidylate deaminase
MSTKLIFTKPFAELKSKLEAIGGEWDESQLSRKVLRRDGGVMNWFESTGTIQFQGKEAARYALEIQVTQSLAPAPLIGPSASPTATTISSGAKQITGTACVSNPDAADYLGGTFSRSEVVIGIVSAVGTDSARVITPFTDRIQRFGYDVKLVRVSEFIDITVPTGTPEYERIKALMSGGDRMRKDSGRNSILAAGIASKIKGLRDSSHPKIAYIVNSLKHPEEVELLRRIYGESFFLVGIHADKKRRLAYLQDDKGLASEQAEELTRIDEDEDIPHGQRTRDTYHLSDFFINLGKNDDQVKNTVKRFLELIFAHPYRNPTFDEFAMFMAFCSSIRSGDLSRQVGAIVARNRQILGTGANECPAFKGGHYWAEVDPATGEVKDRPEGKDYTWEFDSNKAEQREIIEQIMDKAATTAGIQGDELKALEGVLRTSRIKDLTEFGRVVHAEMGALLSCAREGISTRDAELFCTTFPCHNCAKHIIDAGIGRVVYVEPYPKSKALELHDDSIELRTKLDDPASSKKVIFEPFTGVGARRFLDLFSMSLGAGSKLKRKEADGSIVDWKPDTARVRIPVLPSAYSAAESEAEILFNSIVK